MSIVRGTKKGTISGATLMHVVKLSVPVPCKIEYTVRASGNGKNQLRVRFGNLFILVWGKVHDFELEPGESASRVVEISRDHTTELQDGQQDVRFRLSRKALTKAIDYEIEYTIR